MTPWKRRVDFQMGFMQKYELYIRRKVDISLP